MTCSMCGHIFDEHKTEQGCMSCPLHKKNCGLVKCPYCQFEMPAEPKWGKKFFPLPRWEGLGEGVRPETVTPTSILPLPGGGSKISAATLSLDSLKVGHAAQVVFLNTRDSKKAQNLMAMGVFPGSLLTLIQKFPCYVFQLGHSQFAIDQELAKIIFVYPSG